jgi:hypothetical protein
MAIHETLNSQKRRRRRRRRVRGKLGHGRIERLGAAGC